MSETQPDSQHIENIEPLPGCTRRAIFVWGTIVAPVAAGFAFGVAVVVGGEVLFGAFGFPRAADPGLASLFVLTLIAVLLAGILFVLSARKWAMDHCGRIPVSAPGTACERILHWSHRVAFQPMTTH